MHNSSNQKFKLGNVLDKRIHCYLNSRSCLSGEICERYCYVLMQEQKCLLI